MNAQVKMVEQLLAETDVRVNGQNPWDIHVRNERLYSRLLKDGSLGLGEYYMEGWWDCSRTLLAWNDRFQESWSRLAEKFDRRFKRMWEYYLLACAGAFRARHIQVWQIVMTKVGAEQPACRCS